MHLELHTTQFIHIFFQFSKYTTIESMRPRSFVWFVIHGKQKQVTNKQLLWYYSCNWCRDRVETIVHVFSDCPLALEFWMHVVPLDLYNRFFNLNLYQWLDLNIVCNFGCTLPMIFILNSSPYEFFFIRLYCLTFDFYAIYSKIALVS